MNKIVESEPQLGNKLQDRSFVSHLLFETFQSTSESADFAR